MARHEENREDLIAEATSLVDRIELLPGTAFATDSDDAVVIVGVRRSGFLSIYFGQDRFYQFDLESCVRRAYISPFVYRAQFGSLCRLDRQRSSDRTVLVRTDLTESESTEFIAECRRWLQQFLSDIESGDYRVLRLVVQDEESSDEALIAKIQSSLNNVLQRRDDFFSQTIAKRRMK